jgi:hypothetical protein
MGKNEIFTTAALAPEGHKRGGVLPKGIIIGGKEYLTVRAPYPRP